MHTRHPEPATESPLDAVGTQPRKTDGREEDSPTEQRATGRRERRWLAFWQWPLAAACSALLVVCVLPGAQIRLGAAQLQGLIGSYCSSSGLGLSVSPNPLNVPSGGYGLAVVTVVPPCNATGGVQFGLSGVPAGVSYVFYPPAVPYNGAGYNGNPHSTLYLCVPSGTPTGSTTLTVTASDGTNTASVPLTLNVK